MKLTIEGETLELLPEHAVHWASTGILLISDLHWGKAETFQQHGIPVPASILETELERLSVLIERLAPSQVVILGDLIHSAQGTTREVAQTVARRLGQWTQGSHLKFTLILGNHDRKLDHLPASWPIETRTGPMLRGPFSFVHEPAEVPSDHYGFCGHLHPTVLLQGGHDRLRLPCFHVGRRFMVLPAFSHFTRGLIQSKAPGERVFAVAGPSVIEI